MSTNYEANEKKKNVLNITEKNKKKKKTVFNNEHLNVLMFIQEWRAGSVGVCRI